MKFGKSLKQAIEESQPEFHDKFLRYKMLKKTLKSIAEAQGYDDTSGDEKDGNTNGHLSKSNAQEEAAKVKDSATLTQDEEHFVKMLNEELQKFNEFYMEKEEEFVIFAQNIEEKAKKALAEEVPELGALNLLRAAFVKAHGKMVLLQNWSALNYAALVKILKKHDKRTKIALRSRYLYNVLWQPFYCTEVISELISRAETFYSQIVTKQKSLEEKGVAKAEELEEPQLLEMDVKDADLDRDVQDINPSMMKQTQSALKVWLEVKSVSIPVPDEVKETKIENKRPADEAGQEEGTAKAAKTC